MGRRRRRELTNVKEGRYEAEDYFVERTAVEGDNMEMISLRAAVHTNSWQCHVHRDSCYPIQSNKGEFFLTSSTLPLFRTNSDYKGRSPRLKVSCIGWDPEGILGPPQGGHIARREFQKKFGRDAQQREALERQSQQERERRRAAREARVVPETVAGLVEYFLDTEAREIEYEIARCRVRLNEQFLSHLQVETAALRFAVSRTKEMDDRLFELEALHKVLIEGIEAYDRMATDLIGAKDRLAKILTSKDKKATLLEMLERNELDRSLLALLDENIVAAHNAGQVQAAALMEKVRAAVLKYLTI